MSEISLQTINNPLSKGSLWEGDVSSSKASFTAGASNSLSTSKGHQRHGSTNLTIRDESRPFNTMTFMSPTTTEVEDQHSVQYLMEVESMSFEEQEQVLIQELLYILRGVPGCVLMVQYPDQKVNHVSFSVVAKVEHSLKELSLNIAQLAVYYHSVARFVENWCKFESGQVNQALAAALRDIFKDYYLLLSQTETLYMKDELTLQKMWFFVHPTLQVMTILSSIVLEIEKQDCRGGKVLSLLHEKAVSMVGDEVGQNVCYNLAQKASAPYFLILENWIYKGMIRDPLHEFFVHDTDKGDGMMEGNDNDNYWETRYQLVPEKCPSFLKSVNQEILKAGKYLNVIRQCGKDVFIAASTKITYSIHERVYVAAIEKAHAYASKTLLDLLLNEYDLMRRLRSVKHYLLMDQGDFIVQFLDLTESELSKQIDDLNPVRLESLLELALRTSSSTNDPYKDCVRVQLFPYGIAEQMLSIISIETPLEQRKLFTDDFNYRILGFEGFSFSYEVKWPISLVLNARAIICYQMIFRHLFFCKHVERQLCRVWIAKKSFKDSNLANDPEKATTFSLHQKMLNFVQNLQYYMAFEVIEPAWHTFLNTMAKGVTNIDQVLESHLLMVNSILEDSMLTSPSLLARMTTLLSLCLQFFDKIVGNAGSGSPNSTMHSSKSMNFDSQNVTNEELTEKFNKELVDFLREVSTIVQNPNQSSKVANIIYRVNFNGFYTEALENGIDSSSSTRI